MSSRALNQRISNRGNMIRKATALHYDHLALGVRKSDDWETMVVNWCEDLRDGLVEPPHITGLGVDVEMGAIRSSNRNLIEIACERGISRALATDVCEVLLNVTINDAIRRVRAGRRVIAVVAAPSGSRVEPSSKFLDTLRSILAGV